MPVLQRARQRSPTSGAVAELGIRSARMGRALRCPRYRWWVVSPREEPATKVATMQVACRSRDWRARS